MRTLTVTTEQAKHIAALVQAQQQASYALSQAVTLLALGTVPDGCTLAGVSPEAGLLTFNDPAAVELADLLDGAEVVE